MGDCSQCRMVLSPPSRSETVKSPQLRSMDLMESRTETKISPPILFVGFKAYLEATGARAVALSQLAQEASERTGATVVVIPQYTDIPIIARRVRIPVFAQHIDPIEPGSHTGHVLPEAVREAGATGTLVNHSERPLARSNLAKAIHRAREVGLVSCVCCDDEKSCSWIAALGPDMMLIESPELIGTGRAISRTDPSMLRAAVRSVRSVNRNVLLICGAGISNTTDVSAAVEMGLDGVGAASAIVKSDDPLGVLLELAGALVEKFGRRN